ncbi:MAG: magnesium transporter [Acidobacteria bacterium]|nr:magnesium transporter [Acidobacteriota bacterium]
MRSDSATAGLEALVSGYVRLFPGEVARALEAAPPDDASALLAARPVAHAADVVRRLGPGQAAATLARLPARAARRLVEHLGAARSAVLLARLEPDDRDRLLGLVATKMARELGDLTRYPPDTAGALMDPRVAAFPGDTPVKTVLGRLRRRRAHRVYDVFVVDPEGQLTGVVPLQEIALSPGDTRLGTLAQPSVPKVAATAGREEIVEEMAGGATPSLAVVDYEGRLLGVLRYAALMAAAESEASADIQTMVGASKEERALSPVLFAVRKRLPWLQINLGTAFLAASVVGLFEETIQRVTALAILLPVVAGQSGNGGAQALAVTMRGLFLREIRARSWPRVLLKEVGVGALNGLAVAIVCAVGVYLWSRSPGLSLVIGVAMVLSMVVAGMAGAAIPTALSALGQDPAQSSSIILTTVTDVAGFFTFLGLATLFARML